jgi:hypothetical protein
MQNIFSNIDIEAGKSLLSNQNIEAGKSLLSNQNIEAGKSLLNNQNIEAGKSLLNNPTAQSMAVQTFQQAYDSLLPLMMKGLANISFTLNDKSFTFKLNVIKAPVNASTPRYSQQHKLGAYAPTLDLRPRLLPIRDQGKVECCVAFSCACMKEYQSGSSVYLSPSFIYHLRDNPKEYDCMTITNGLDILTNYGTCYELTYPQADITSSLGIPTNAYNEAIYFKIYSYIEIHSMDELKDALSQFGPCLISFPVYNFSRELWIQNAGDTFHGGHCMTVVGYDTFNFIIRNTWSTHWGDNGYTYYPFSQWGAHWDIYTCTRYGSLPPPPPKFIPTTAPNSVPVGISIDFLKKNITIANKIQLPVYVLIIVAVVFLFLLLLFMR